MKIAVVGTGISGLVAAHRLDPDHDVTVFEADRRVGGHANTVEVEVDGRRHQVDTGFIVYNEANYPGFAALLRELGVVTQPTEMSFGVTDARTGLEYRGSNLNTLFAQRRNLVRPSFLRLLAEIARFNRAARALVAERGRDPEAEAADATNRSRTSWRAVTTPGRSSNSSSFRSAPRSGRPTPRRSPASRYAPTRVSCTITDSSRRRRGRLAGRSGARSPADRGATSKHSPHRSRRGSALGTPVHKIVSRAAAPDESIVELLTDRGPERFDRVVLATHSDQALRLLGDSTPAEQSILGSIHYQHNVATLHTDARFLPREPRARASWNYAVDPAGRHPSVTYWMNSLQAIKSTRPLLVTLNSAGSIAPDLVLAQFDYHHPVFDAAAMRAQRRRPEIQGRRGIYFAGAYWGYGFHEDGLQSGLDVARAIGPGR